MSDGVSDGSVISEPIHPLHTRSPASSITLGYLGNSFIYYNDLPTTLRSLRGGAVKTSHLCLRGGCSLTSLADEGARHPLVSNTLHETVADMFADGRQFTFVIMNDFSQGPARLDSRAETVASLNAIYSPLLRQSGASPVIMATWSYRKHEKNSDDLGTVPEFTQRLFEGACEYKAALDASGVKAAIVAPCGHAFQTVWEERRELWEALFVEDNYHPSPKGTALIARVIYCAVWGTGGSVDDFVFDEETRYFWDVAERACAAE